MKDFKMLVIIVLALLVLGLTWQVRYQGTVIKLQRQELKALTGV